MNYKLPAIIAFSLLVGGAILWFSVTLKQTDPITLPPSDSKATQPKEKTQEEWFYSMAKNQKKDLLLKRVSDIIFKYCAEWRNRTTHTRGSSFWCRIR